MYEELVKQLRNCTSDTVEDCAGCPYRGGYKGTYCMNGLITEAAEAIEELLRAAKKMHTWIFLNTGDEQKAYDECGLSDEMDAALGYSGQFRAYIKEPKEKT